MSVPPQRPLDPGWSPDLSALRSEFGSIIDIDISVRRFKNFYSEGQTARNWQGRLENWILNDVERAGTRHGTDDLGVPYHQKRPAPMSVDEQAQQDLIDLARRSAQERTEQADD